MARPPPRIYAPHLRSVAATDQRLVLIAAMTPLPSTAVRARSANATPANPQNDRATNMVWSA